MNDKKEFVADPQEGSISGGYMRIKGYERFSSHVVPGVGPVISVFILHGVVHAIRSDGTNDVLYTATDNSWVRQ